MTQMETPEQSAAASDRVARFKADVADMRLRDPKATRDRVWAGIGMVLMIAGVITALIAYFASTGADPAFNSEGPAEQRDAIVLGLVGVAITLLGAALFVRYSFAQFLRFWLARLIYEQQAQTDRIVGSK